MAFAPGLILAFLVLAVSTWLIRKTAKPIREAKEEFSAEDWELFQELTNSKTNPTEMPSKFQSVAEANRQLMKIMYGTMAAFALATVAIVVFGWDLGLAPNQ